MSDWNEKELLTDDAVPTPENTEEAETEQTPAPLDKDGTIPELTGEAKEEPAPYTPRPLGFRIFALVLAALVIVGLILYYTNIFNAGR